MGGFLRPYRDWLMKPFVAFFVCLLLFHPELRAQGDPAPTSRAEKIDQEQSAIAQTLGPDEPTPFERHFKLAEKDARRILQGPVRLQVGGLSVPSGFAVGPSVTWQNSADTLRLNSWAVGSVRQYYSVGTGLELPRIGGRHTDITVKAAHNYLPQLDYYGPGPNSIKSNRTDYLLEDTRLDFGVAWPYFSSHVKPRCDLAQVWLNVGPGTSDAVTSTNLKFGPAQAPGIDNQSNYLIAGCGLRFDFRDLPDNPHKGTALFLDYRGYNAEKTSLFSFTRASGAVEH